MVMRTSQNTDFSPLNRGLFDYDHLDPVNDPTEPVTLRSGGPGYSCIGAHHHGHAGGAFAAAAAGHFVHLQHRDRSADHHDRHWHAQAVGVFVFPFGAAVCHHAAFGLECGLDPCDFGQWPRRPRVRWQGDCCLWRVCDRGQLPGGFHHFRDFDDCELLCGDQGCWPCFRGQCPFHFGCDAGQADVDRCGFERGCHRPGNCQEAP